MMVPKEMAVPAAWCEMSRDPSRARGRSASWSARRRAGVVAVVPRASRVGPLAAVISSASRVVPLAALAFAFLSLAAAPRLADASSPKNLGEQFVIGRLKYAGGGDWYGNQSSIRNIQRALAERVGIPTATEERTVSILDVDLFETPFLTVSGHGTVRFSQEEAERLRHYLRHGGFLWADDDYGMDESFRPEMRKVFPEAELVELPFDHEIYHCFYDLPDGLPKIHEHHGGPPHGYGIFQDGRLVVFYSFNTDIRDGTEDPEVHKDPPEKREAAMRMAMNVVVYALSH